MGAARMKTVGDRCWTHGPIVLSSRWLHDKWCQEFSEAEARRLRGLRKACGVLTIAGQQILFAWNEGPGQGGVPWGGRKPAAGSGYDVGRVPANRRTVGGSAWALTNVISGVPGACQRCRPWRRDRLSTRARRGERERWALTF